MRWRSSPDEDIEAVAKAVAARVVEERHRRGLSQAELAELCATTQSAIARLEAGVRPPRVDTLVRIANALDCNLQIDLKPRTKSGGGR